MNTDLAQKAISSAIKGNWEEAKQINKEILKDSSSDIDALNRIARCCAELGDITNARKYAKNVIAIDPFNKIATKSLGKWKNLKKGETFKSGASSGDVFLEEPGKTKIVNLIHLGSSKVVAKLDSGDEVKINPHSHRVSISAMNNDYVGKLPDDISSRMRKLIKYGNKYIAHIKSVDNKIVKVFLREVERSKNLTDTQSFPSEKIDYISFTPPELVHKKSETQTVEQQDESE